MDSSGSVRDGSSDIDGGTDTCNTACSPTEVEKAQEREPQAHDMSENMIQNVTDEPGEQKQDHEEDTSVSATASSGGATTKTADTKSVTTSRPSGTSDANSSFAESDSATCTTGETDASNRNDNQAEQGQEEVLQERATEQTEAEKCTEKRSGNIDDNTNDNIDETSKANEEDRRKIDNQSSEDDGDNKVADTSAKIQADNDEKMAAEVENGEEILSVTASASTVERNNCNTTDDLSEKRAFAATTAATATAAAASRAAASARSSSPSDSDMRRDKMRYMVPMSEEQKTEEGEADGGGNTVDKGPSSSYARNGNGETKETEATEADDSMRGSGFEPALQGPRRSSDHSQFRRASQEYAVGRRLSQESTPGAFHIQPISDGTFVSERAEPAERAGSSTLISDMTSTASSWINRVDRTDSLSLTRAQGEEGHGEGTVEETALSSVAVATPIEAHTYVEAIEITTEISIEDDDEEGGSAAAKKQRRRKGMVVAAALAIVLAMAVGLGVGLRSGGGGGRRKAPVISLSNVPISNTSTLVEVNVTFASSAPSSMVAAPASGNESVPDSVLLGLGASAMVRGSPSAMDGGLLQVLDRETVSKSRSSELFYYKETLQISPYASELPRGIAPQEVLVGAAFDSSGRITNVAVSFLGRDGGPGFVRVFGRENGKGIRPNGRNWTQVGQDVGLGLVNSFIDPQSDGFAAGYGASVGYSANRNAHLLVGSNAGFARLYFLQTLGDDSRWVRIDENRIMSPSNDDSTDNPVVVASRNYRFAVAYPREGAGMVQLFEMVDPRTDEPLDLESIPIEAPATPRFRQIGQTLEGSAAGDGFGRSLSLDIAGNALVIGCEKGNYIQTFRFDRETNRLQQFGSTIVGEPEDEESFGSSLTLGYFAANAGSCPTCEFQTDGLRMIVGSPSYNSTRGRAVVFEYNDADAEWKRFPFLMGAMGTEMFGHSVSLSIEQSTISVTYRGDSTDGTGTRMWRITKSAAI